MRLDWSVSKGDEIGNQWIPIQQFEKVITQYDISISLLQQTLNELIFSYLHIFD